MSIFHEKDKAGKLTGTLIVKVMRKGVVYTHRTKDRKEAREAEQCLKAGLGLPEASKAPAAATVRTLYDKAVDLYHGQKDELKSWSRLKRAFEALGYDLRLAEIKTPHIDVVVKKLQAKGLDNKTINRYLASISKALKWAQRRDMMPQGLPHIPRLRESPGRLAFLTEAEEALLLERLRENDRHDLATMTRVLIVSGFRIQELMTRKPQDLREGWLHLSNGETKNDKGRAIFLGD